MNKRFIITSITIAILIISIITVSSYAYFTIGNKTGNEDVITSGTMSLSFTDGAEVTANNLVPGQYIEKSFSITNTGNVNARFDVYLSGLINEFTDKTDLVYEIISNDGGYNTTNQVEVPDTETKIIDQQLIAPNATQHYVFKLTFLNKQENQNDNMNKFFMAKLQVNNYESINTNIKYYLDNVEVSSLPTKANSNYLSSSCTDNLVLTFDQNNWTYNISNVNANNATCSIYFREINIVYNFEFDPDGDGNGQIQKFTVSSEGIYKLETWGAQGGSYNTTYHGGYGGYSVGLIDLDINDELYIVVGSSVSNSLYGTEAVSGCGTYSGCKVALPSGYNGGGSGVHRGDVVFQSGGGATHIALETGLLQNLVDYKDSNGTNISNEILIVSGGGGGGSFNGGVRGGIGGSAGGFIGSNGQYTNQVNCESYGEGGTQTTGGNYYAITNHNYYSSINIPTSGFGYGGQADYNIGGAGGGAGWFGGRGTSCIGGGGGGSGYIGSSNLISSNGITKHMTCYNCTESNDASTKTESNTCHDVTATSDCAKEGNGHARITYLGN